ncbi:Hypothetical predicted protein [Mytilus galloprovincialis]|uniref:Novel STAND NTPase 3 domain-containing protein n=1 Tax=Mytilus galloprovincialis TaxID=29158 RepID=A0A8B6CSQ9_MYTGA|nr:Hypothetical predicted protein [Mytilus galloprovincialis]
MEKLENEQEEVIPKNIRDQMKIQITDWEEKDKMFVTTRASEYIMKCLRKNSCLTITAPSGVGKSFIARHSALGLQKEGYTIIPVGKPDDIRDYYQPGKQAVFIVDDICGNFTANQQQIENWQQLLTVIETIIAEKCCKIIVSCRLQCILGNSPQDQNSILISEKEEHSDLKEKMKKMENEQYEVIPKNIRDQIEKEIKEWENNDKMFVTTRASEYVFACLRNNSCLTLTAPSGVGKSFIARHTSLVLQKEGYTIIPVRKPDNISEYYQPGKHTVFIVDDICGNFTANQQHIESWQQLLPVIKTIIADTCYSLSRCGVEGKFKLCSLALLVLFNNQLKDKWFHGKVTDEQRHILEDTCEACRLNRSTSKAELKEALNTLDGTFVYKQNGIYRTVHDKLFDFLAHFFGQIMIECLIDHGDSDFVHERFIWKQSSEVTNNIVEFIIEIPGDYLEAYLKRFINDWSTGKVRVAFCNNNIKIPLFRRQLIHYLQQLNKSQQTKLANTRDTMLPNEHHGSGTTPLMLPCLNGYTDMLQWMLNNDVDVNHHRDDGATGLHMASQEGHTEIVKLLLDRNPNVDQCSTDGRSPLYVASLNGHTEIVKLLLERNPSIDLCDINGWGPLRQAIRNGHIDIVKLLLEKYSNIDIYDTINGWGPLKMASQEGHTEIVKLLLDYFPNIDNCDTIYGCSPLYMACQNGHTDIVKLLLEKSPNIDLCDNIYGSSPLHVAILMGHTVIVKLLLEQSPNIDLCDTIFGRSPLWMASVDGHTEIVKLLLERNPSIDLCEEDGSSPLCVASCEGHTEIVKLLLEKNPSIDLCDEDGCSPLYMASQNGNTEIVKLLLEKNPNIDLCDKDGCSPLEKASQNGHTDIIRLLSEKKSKC